MPRVKPAALPRDDDDEVDDATSRDGSFTQRVVPAASAAPPPTTAANSVFGQLAPKKVGRPPGTKVMQIDVDAVEIRTDVPLPPAAGPTGRHSAYRELLDKMGKGHSVVLPGRQALSLVSAARKIGIKVQLRKLEHDAAAVAKHGPDVAGVWRLS